MMVFEPPGLLAGRFSLWACINGLLH